MAFETTTWSLIKHVKSNDPQIAGEALNQLCQNYWQPLYSWLRQSGRNREDALDTVQGFFHYAIGSKLFQKADAERGKLRSFLLGSLKNYINKEWQKSQTLKSGGQIDHLSLHDNDVSVEEKVFSKIASDLSPAEIYEKRWAHIVLDRANDRLEAKYQERSKANLLATLKPFLYEAKPSNLDRETAASDLSMTSNNFDVALHRLRKELRKLVKEEVAKTLSDNEELDEEMQYLYRCLADG